MKKFFYFVFLASLPSFIRGQDSSSSDYPAFTVDAFFSQDLYVAGDTAFFHVVLTPTPPLLFKGTLLLHLDLINAIGNIVFKQNFRVKDGAGGNQLIIPKHFEAGAYIFSLRLNGDTQHTFNKAITIAGKKDLTNLEVAGNIHSPPGTRRHQPSFDVLGVNAEYLGRQKVEVVLNTHQPKGQLVKSTVAVRVINSKVAAMDLSKTKNQHLSVYSNIHEASANDPKLKYSTNIAWSGNVYHKNTEIPVPDSTHVAIFLLKNKIGYDFYTGKGGYFKVTCNSDFMEEDKVFVLAAYQGKELPVDWVVEQEASSSIPTLAIPHSANTAWYSEFSENKREIDRAFYFFKGNASAVMPQVDPGDRLEDEFQSPDITVKMKDYMIFPTMEEIVNEIIPALSLKRKGDELILKMNLLISLDNPVASKATPLLIIDEVMTKDINHFLSLKPAELVSIKLIRKMNKLLPWGLLGKDGIVFVTTKSTSIANEITADYPQVKGITEALPFPYKNYSLPSNPLVPDFRTLLYWNPELAVDESGDATFSFYTADSMGEFIIQVEGETKNGEIHTGDHQFKVSLRSKE